VPEDRDAFWALANDVANRLQSGEAVLIHCAGGVHGGNNAADRNAFLVRLASERQGVIVMNRREATGKSKAAGFVLLFVIVGVYGVRSDGQRGTSV
jgi:hypothetical protein